jgi:deoxyribodipyrimidine photolyase-related protein
MSKHGIPQRLILVTFDQLSITHGALATAVAERDEIVFIESHDMLTSRKWHSQRLFFILSAVEHIKSDLEASGFTVRSIKAATMSEGVNSLRLTYPGVPIVSTTPSSRPLTEVLTSLDVDLFPNDNFLTTAEQFSQWKSGYKSLTMEYFYRWQRKRLNILMDGNDPVGGQWNFDEDNRLPPPRAKKVKPHTSGPNPCTSHPIKLIKV